MRNPKLEHLNLKSHIYPMNINNYNKTFDGILNYPIKSQKFFKLHLQNYDNILNLSHQDDDILEGINLCAKILNSNIYPLDYKLKYINITNYNIYNIIKVKNLPLNFNPSHFINWGYTSKMKFDQEQEHELNINNIIFNKDDALSSTNREKTF